MRGGFNDWGNPSPTDEFLFINFGERYLSGRVQMAAGEYNYKVGSAGWEVERATVPDDVLEVGDTQRLVDPGPADPRACRQRAQPTGATTSASISATPRTR